MNIFQEAKQILDKDGKVNALGPFGKGKLTGREVSAYFRRNKVKDPEVKKAVEVALDMGGAYDIAGKEIQKFYGRKIRNSKEVENALKYANEETHRAGEKLDEINTNMPEKVRVQLLTLYNKAMDVPYGSPAFKGVKKQIDKINSKYAVKSEDQSLGKSPTLDEGQSILAKDIQGLKAISDIEIRFSDEKEWKRMSALVKRELSKPEFKKLPKAYYIDDPLQIGFGHAHKSKAKINIKPIVDLVVKNTKDKQTRLKSLDEGISNRDLLRSKRPVVKTMNSGQKKQFDTLYKKMDGGKEHMAIKKKIKNQVKADDAFHALVMKKVMGEEITEAQYTNHAGNKVKELLNVYEVPYSRMKGEPDISSIEALAKKSKLRVKALKDKVMARMAIDVYGSPENLKKFHKAVMKLKIKNAKAIKFTKAFDYKVTESVDITEGKLGDSIIRKDFPNVWAASAKDRNILKKFHAKVDTSNYKKQKQLYNKNKKAFMSGLGKEKLSSIMKKMTVKKGPMKGWMTDEVTHRVAESEVTRAKELADLKDKHKREIEKEKEDIKDIQKDEQVIPFFDTYRNMQEEVANITVDPRNKIAKVNQQNTHALNIHKAAQRMGLKSAMVGKNIRVKGSKKNINDFMRVVIGKSSYGDPTEKDMSTPQIDKMLSKNLK